MLAEYVDEALRCARYKLIDDDDAPFCGEVPELPGAWTSCRPLEGCPRSAT